MLTTCYRYPVCIVLTMTSFHCFIVFCPGIIDTHRWIEWRKRNNRNVYLSELHMHPVFWGGSDGGVWQSSLQKASFPSRIVDQLSQETFCQTGTSLAQRYLRQVSLNFFLLSSISSLCAFYRTSLPVIIRVGSRA